MKPHEINILSWSMLRNLQQINDSLEPRFPREFGGNIRELNALDRINLDLPAIHRITIANLYVRPLPDAYAARDTAAANARSESFGEHHAAEFSPGIATQPMRCVSSSKELRTRTDSNRGIEDTHRFG